MSRILILCGAAALLAGAAGADTLPVRTLPVSYADLNIHSPAGVQALMGRLEHAAQMVCNNGASIRDLNDRPRYNACRQDAVGKAVQNIGAPELVAAWRGDVRPSQVASK
jgi:UrcA family protein